MTTPVFLSALLVATLGLAGLPASGAPLPRRIGACSRTTVKEILYRLGSTDANGVVIPVAGSGSAISYTNGGYQVSYDTVPAIHRSRAGDPVELCLTFVPDCRQPPAATSAAASTGPAICAPAAPGRCQRASTAAAGPEAAGGCGTPAFRQLWTAQDRQDGGPVRRKGLHALLVSRPAHPGGGDADGLSPGTASLAGVR
jgi:hypothetical protein